MPKKLRCLSEIKGVHIGTLGCYKIYESNFDKTKYWVEHRSGEAMEVSEADLKPIIEKAAEKALNKMWSAKF